MEVTLEDLAGPDAATVLRALRESAALTWIDPLGGWLVTRHDVAVAVMRDERTFTVDDPRFSTAQVVGPSMLSTDGAEHRRHRSPFVAPFRPKQVEERFGATTHRIAAELVDAVRADGGAELRTAVAGPLSVAVVARTLGLGDVDSGSVLRWYAAIVAAVSAITAGQAVGDEARAAVAELDREVRASLRGETLLDAARPELSDAEIVSNAAVMMFGGIETTEGMIANAIVHLVQHPAARRQILADPSQVTAAIEESLRLEPAAAVVDRYATADVRLDGVAVAAGDLVRVSLAAANRDPAVFAEPDAFHLYRPNVRSQLSFARGPHACIAMDLARLEAAVAVRTVFERLPGLQLSGPAPVTGLVFRKPLRVPVRWEIASAL